MKLGEPKWIPDVMCVQVSTSSTAIAYQVPLINTFARRNRWKSHGIASNIQICMLSPPLSIALLSCLRVCMLWSGMSTMLTAASFSRRHLVHVGRRHRNVMPAFLCSINDVIVYHFAGIEIHFGRVRKVLHLIFMCATSDIWWVCLMYFSTSTRCSHTCFPSTCHSDRGCWHGWLFRQTNENTKRVFHTYTQRP